MEPGPGLNTTVGRSDWPYREIIAIAGGQLELSPLSSQQTFQEFSASGAASGVSALSSSPLFSSRDLPAGKETRGRRQVGVGYSVGRERL